MAEKILMIALSPTMETGTLTRWRKKEGDRIASGEVLCEIETDKATMDYESGAEGTLLRILLPEGGQAKVGETIAIVGSPGDDIGSLVAETGSTGNATDGPGAPKLAARTAAPAQRKAATASTRPRASPLARRLADEMGIDLRRLRGSGPDGRIVKRDLETWGAARAGAQLAGQKLPASQPPSEPSLEPAPGDQLIPVSPMRRIIASRLSESMRAAPHYFLTVSIGMDPLIEARASLNVGRERKIGLNAFLLAVTGRLLARHPQVNSSWNGDTILRHSTADIGLAVALPEGLITPVVRDCGRKAVLAIDEELANLVERAREGKLAPAEYAGATFTISSLGSAGIDEFTAIINPPGSAILAIGAIRKEPVVDEGDVVVVRQRMRATLSCDHRVIDGAVGAAFLRELADMLENPVLALA